MKAANQPALESKLARIKHYATRYEITASNNVTGEKLLVMYGPKSRNAIVRGLLSENRIELLSAKTSTNPSDWMICKGGVETGPWKVSASGRTQRDSFITGELPSIY